MNNGKSQFVYLGTQGISRQILVKITLPPEFVLLNILSKSSWLKILEQLYT